MSTTREPKNRDGEMRRVRQRVVKYEEERGLLAPFVDAIKNTPVPPGFKMPNIPLYNGNQDPNEHVHTFLAWMELLGASNALMCQVFPLTINNSVIEWYEELTPRSITSFAELAHKFINAFGYAKSKPISKFLFLHIKQGENESLKSYIDRFYSRFIEIDDISDEGTFMAVFCGLWSKYKTGFAWEVLGNGPTTYTDTEFLSRAQRYIAAEEILADLKTNHRTDEGSSRRPREERDRDGGGSPYQEFLELEPAYGNRILAPERENVAELESPFVDAIRYAPLPDNFKMPSIRLYDGKKDPEAHLSIFETHMSLCGRGASTEVMCRAFPVTLIGSAGRWFRKLSPRIITCWTKLANMFANRFAWSKIQFTPTVRLVGIRQGESDTLKSYITRFQDQVINMFYPADEAKLMAVISGLLVDTDFWWKVIVNEPKTYNEFLDRAWRQIDIEDMIAAVAED